MRGIRRAKGTAPNGKAPILTPLLLRMVAALPNDVSGLRDKAILLIGFAGAFRRSELVGLQVRDAQISDAGLIITLRRSKTDQEGASFTKGIPIGTSDATCPKCALEAWLQLAGISSGPIFRPAEQQKALRKRYAMHELRFLDFAFDATPAHFQGEQRPIEEIRLIVVDAVTGTIQHDWMSNIGRYFTSNDTLVWNDVGISRSHLGGIASTGATVDICFLLQDTQNGHIWDVVVLAEHDLPQSGTFELADGSICGEFLGKTLDFDAPYYIERDRYQGYRGRVRIQARADQLRHVLQTSGMYMHPWYVNLNELPESILNPTTTHKSGSVLLSEPARRLRPRCWLTCATARSHSCRFHWRYLLVGKSSRRTSG